MSGTKEQVLEAVINNPKAQGATVAGLAGLFADTTLIQSANIYIAFVGGCLGIILSSLMIYKNFKQLRNSE